MNSHALTKVYDTEHDAHVKERILLIIKVSSDKQHIESISQELHRSRDWTYKWYKKYNDEGLEGLRDRQRSGTPSVISKEMRDKIRQELADSNIGLGIRQVMGIIQKRTGGIKYHKVHIRRPLHLWGFSPRKVPQKRFVRRASKEEKNSLKKGTKDLNHA